MIFLIYTKSILLSLLLSVIEWKTTVSASVPRDVLRANNVLCTLASNLCRLDNPANISQVGHVWPEVATSVFNMATRGNRIQVARHLYAM